MKRTRTWMSWLPALALLGACADGRPIDPDPTDPDDPLPCGLDSDCPGGLVCVAAQCVSPEDRLPPEIEVDEDVPRPAASSRYLFALAKGADQALIIEPVALSVTPVQVAPEPVDLAVVPGRDAAVVLSAQGRALTRLSVSEGAVEVTDVPLDRAHGRVDLSPDGRWALLWTPDGAAPAGGAEGLVALVDLSEPGPAEVFEVAAGYRHTDVRFASDRGRATHAVVVGKDEVVRIDLDRLAADPAHLPAFIPLPEAFAEAVGREVVAAPDGEILVLSTLGAPEVALLDVRAAELLVVPMPARVTDVDLAPDGSRVVAALRSISQVALLPLPVVPTSTEAIRFLDVAGARPGQVVVSPDGAHAALFSRAGAQEAVAWLDLETGETRVLSRLRKRIRAVSISPDARSLVVLHQAVPTSSVADPYERRVDREEGYSMVDLETGRAQLVRTASAAPQAVVFGATGRSAAVTVRDDRLGRHRLHAADLDTLRAEPLSLGSAPEFAGALPQGDGDLNAVWVTQVHPAGRISVLDLDTRSLRTLTGYRLNAEIRSKGESR